MPKIVSTIKERVREYQDQVLPIQRSVGPSASRGILDEECGQAILDTFRSAHEVDEEVKTDEGADQDDSHIRIVSFDDELLDNKIMTVDEAMACIPSGSDDEDLRFNIKLDIMVGTQNLSDFFEWDLNSTVTPEEFAASYCKDLGLTGEFITAIAHDIHEQIVVHQRTLFLVGHTHGSGFIQNDDARQAFLDPLSNALRKEDVAMSTYTPVLANFTEADVQAIEKERERERKRSKRGTRGRRGVVLPDREPAKTSRTLLHPHVDPNLAPVAETTPAPLTNSTRRAAAIAAQANINLALQDLPIPQPPSPPPLSAISRGHKKQLHQPRMSSRGVSRASPASTREGSVTNGDLGTPTIGFKRHLREDSEPETGSPFPPRKRHNGRIVDSPDGDEDVKPEAPPIKSWHCKNCGVPETLAGGKRKDANGELDLCAKCGDHLQHIGRRRQVEYNEDEEYHLRQRDGTDSNQSPSFGSPSQPTFDLPPVANSPRRRERSSSQEASSSDSDSDDSDDFEGSKRRKKAKLVAKRTSTPLAKPAPTPAPVTPATPATPLPDAPVPPAWVPRVRAALQAKYADHRFTIVAKSRPADAGADLPPEWRAKCLDCPGKIYQLGPDETLDNFESHLKFKGHMANVQARLDAERK